MGRTTTDRTTTDRTTTDPAANGPTANGTASPASSGSTASPGNTDPSESLEERLQREHEQLFHELRAIIPGGQVLFAFLLTVAFSERFRELDQHQRWVYYLTFLTVGVSLLLLLAPASFHRVQFRRGDKEAMMRIANVEALIALVLISLSVAGTMFLITDLMFSASAAIGVAAVMWVVTGLVWWGVPMRRRLSERRDAE